VHEIEMPDSKQLAMLEDCLQKGATALDVCNFLVKVVPDCVRLLAKEDKTKQEILSKRAFVNKTRPLH
jgi:hypothetical protein